MDSGCAGWHDTRNSDWSYDTYFSFIRGNTGVFSFSIGDWTGNVYCGRGVAVVGTGL